MAQAWFRFYSETLHDRKIERICRQTAEPKAVIVGAWAILLALANDSPVRGALLLTENVPLTTGDILDEMGLPPDNANHLLRCFCDLDMIHQDEGTWYVTHFGDRQYDSDNSTERVQRYRERQKTVSPDDDKAATETLQQRDGNAPEAEADQKQNRDRTETEAEAEQTQTVSAVVALAGVLSEGAVMKELPTWPHPEHAAALVARAMADKRIKNKAGFVRSELRKGWTPPADNRKANADWLGYDPTESGNADPPDPPPDIGDRVPRWPESLLGRMDPSTYNHHFLNSTARFVDSKVIVTVPASSLLMVEKRLRPTIEAALASHGKTVVIEALP